jgi:hypothetical protein
LDKVFWVVVRNVLQGVANAVDEIVLADGGHGECLGFKNAGEFNTVGLILCTDSSSI